MTFNQIISSILILLGAGIMLLSILGTRQLLCLIRQNKYVQAWRILFYLMIFFMIGYGGALLLILFNLGMTLLFLVGVIFFFGALFVYLMEKQT